MGKCSVESAMLVVVEVFIGRGWWGHLHESFEDSCLSGHSGTKFGSSPDSIVFQYLGRVLVGLGEVVGVSARQLWKRRGLLWR
jgi:hypothetical protein